MDRRLLLPPDPAFPAALRRAHAASEFLRETFPDPESPELLEWVATAGVLEAPDTFARFFPPIPPEHLRATSCGGPTEHTHLRTGLGDFTRLAELWELYVDRPFDGIDGVLDFGVGCGRVLWRFATHLEPARCVGVDVRAACIRWLQANHPGTYLVGSTRPPLDLPDDRFDLVYSLSVFSHLNRASSDAWIRELCRVCRPDGVILLSTHGAFALALLAQSEEHRRSLCVTRAEAIRYLRELPRRHFLFHGLELDLVRGLDGPEDEYGQTFFDEAFVRAEWADAVELLGCIPASQNLFQDFFVLRPRKGASA